MKQLFILLLIFSNTLLLQGQDPHRFDQDIKKFKTMDIPISSELVVFTGSSSIRFWESVKRDCNQWDVVNTGFGGSHMSDLLYFLEETVLRYKPKVVYIYEGDNDVAAGKNPTAIMKNTRQVTDKILQSIPDAQIYFISAKPSPSRWSYKDQYLAFNALLKEYCETKEQLSYVDVWHPMINASGRANPKIFVADSLHMNSTGYELWKSIICPN